MNKSFEQLQQDLKDKNEELDAQNEELSAAIEQLMLKNETLKDLNEQLSHRNEELDKIIYRTYHDLKSPISSILGLSNVIKLENQGIESHMNSIESMAIKMEKLIRDLMFFSRNLNEDLKYEPVDLERFVYNVLKSLEHLDQYRTVDIYVDIIQKKEFSIDHFRLELILSHLISNALIFSKPIGERKIEITGHVNHNICYINISDNGIGMQQETINNAGSFFYRGSEKSTGAGLGLYLVKNAIEKLGGEFILNSEYDKGTKAEVKLPLLQKI